MHVGIAKAPSRTTLSYLGFHGNLHGGRRLIQPELNNDVIQPFFASAFLLKFFPVSQAPQLFDVSWRTWRTHDSQFDGARHYHLISIQEAPAKPTPER
jgi:hypothetical protein